MDPPHILLVTICSVRTDRLALYGHDRDTMPALTRLAQESTLFENAYANATFTVPSHASLLTGRLPTHNGILALGDRLSAGVPTLQEELGRSNYRRLLLTERPFEFLGAARSPRGFDGAHGVVDWRTQEAMKWLQSQVQSAEGPIFTLVHIRDAHEPYGAGPPFTQAENREIKALLEGKMRSPGLGATGSEGEQNTSESELLSLLATNEAARAEFLALYDSGLFEADEVLSRVLDTWESLLGWDNTILVVLADHGELLGEDGRFGHQADLLDAVLHVPLLLRLPSGASAGQRIAQDVALVDLMPTLLEATGSTAPPRLDGRSLLPILAGEALGPRPVLSQLLLYQRDPKSPPELREALIYQDVRLHRGQESPWQLGPEGDERLTEVPVHLQETVTWMEAWRSGLQAPLVLAERSTLSAEEVRRVQHEGYWSPPDAGSQAATQLLSLVVSVTDQTGSLEGSEIDVVLGGAENNIRRLRNDGEAPDPSPDDEEWTLAMTLNSRATQVLEVLVDDESVYWTDNFQVASGDKALALRIEHTHEGWTWSILSEAVSEDGGDHRMILLLGLGLGLLGGLYLPRSRRRRSG